MRLNKAEKRLLRQTVGWVRRHDRGRGENPYVIDRALSDAPFHESLRKVLQSMLGSTNRKLTVLEKGAGTGRMLAEIKKMCPERIDTTAITLSKEIMKAKNARFINRVLEGPGINFNHERKYDIIYEYSGEDYHLPKQLVEKSILNSVSLLRKGGFLFTVLPLVYRPGTHDLTIAEGKRMIASIRQKKPTLKVKAAYLNKRVDFFEYVAVVIRIQKP